MNIRPLRWTVLTAVVILLLVASGFTDNLEYGIGRHWGGPTGQPPQKSSRVDYDPNLTDPFFKSEWRYPNYIHVLPNRSLENHLTGERTKNPWRFGYTADCVANDGEVPDEPLGFSEVRLLDVNMIDMLIHEHTASSDNSLLVQIRNGIFSCQYWTWFLGEDVVSDGEIMWTTTEQKLTLDKKVYHKGDVLKGRIHFKCRQEPTDPRTVGGRGLGWRGNIRVHGVFKTIVE